MEGKIINRIVESYELEFYEKKDYEKCLAKAKIAYKLLEKDEFKSTKEQFHIYLTLLMIVRCKIVLKKNKTKKMLKYMLLSLYYSTLDSDKIFIYYLISKYYEWIENNKKSKYYLDIVDKYEIELNDKGCFSKTYSKFIEVN